MKRLIPIVLGLVAMTSALAVRPTWADDTSPTVPDSVVKGRLGDVRLLDTDGHELTHGDATTQFLVRLPDGSTCPGDSANDQWRLNTFLVPIEEDPMGLLYGGSGPEPPWTSGRYPLFDSEQQLPIVFQFLQRNEVAGQPGRILAIPISDFRTVAEQGFPGGHYRLGVACAYFAQTTQYWDTPITLTAAAAGGDPSQLTWTLDPAATPPAPAQKSSDSSWPAYAIAAAVIALIIAAVLRLRRANRSPSRHDTSRHDKESR